MICTCPTVQSYDITHCMNPSGLDALVAQEKSCPTHGARGTIAKKKFVDAVVAQLGNDFTKLDERDREAVKGGTLSLFGYNFSVEDAVAFNRLTEELGCTLSEDEALAEMAKIKSKYFQVPLTFEQAHQVYPRGMSKLLSGLPEGMTSVNAQFFLKDRVLVMVEARTYKKVYWHAGRNVWTQFQPVDL